MGQRKLQSMPRDACIIVLLLGVGGRSQCSSWQDCSMDSFGHARYCFDMGSKRFLDLRVGRCQGCSGAVLACCCTSNQDASTCPPSSGCSGVLSHPSSPVMPPSSLPLLPPPLLSSTPPSFSPLPPSPSSAMPPQSLLLIPLSLPLPSSTPPSFPPMSS